MQDWGRSAAQDRVHAVVPASSLWSQLATSRLKRIASVTTFGLAVLGSGIGLFNFKQATDINVDVSARQTGFDRRSFEVDIVNHSQRAVSIRKGTLRFDGYEVGEVKRLTPRQAGDDDPRSTIEGLGASELPFGMAGGQAFAGTLEWRLPVGVSSPEVTQRLERYLGAPRRGGQPHDNRFTLELAIDPGDEIKRSIRLSVSATEPGTRQPGHRRGWRTAIELARSTRRVEGITVFPERDGPSVVTFELWGRQVRPIHTARRPAATSLLGTSFRLPRGLVDGEYTWALSISSETVAVGRFSTPCPATAPRARDQRQLSSETCVADFP